MATKKSRKNPRAQVALRARYRSPTIFEFVEEECFDLSAGGMFIKSEAPAPAGTLLKLECAVRDGDETLRGVARVVWLREREIEGQPAGMGVKFVKLEAGSREIIHRILVERGSIVPEAPVSEPPEATAGLPPGAPPSRPPSVVPIKIDFGHGAAANAARASVHAPAGGAASSAPEAAAPDRAALAAQPAAVESEPPQLSSLPPSEPPVAAAEVPAVAARALAARAERAAVPQAIEREDEAADEGEDDDSERPAAAVPRGSGRPRTGTTPAPTPSSRRAALLVLGVGIAAFVAAIAFALRPQPPVEPSPAVVREVPAPSASAAAATAEPPAAEATAIEPSPTLAATAVPEPTVAVRPVEPARAAEPARERRERPAAEPEEDDRPRRGHEADTAATKALYEQLAREAAAKGETATPAAATATAVPATSPDIPAAGEGTAPLAAAATTAPQPAPALNSYVLQVVTTPEGAQVSAAGKSAVSPCFLELGALEAPVELRAELAGYAPVIASIDRIGFMLDDGRMRRRVSLTLRPALAPEPEPQARPSRHRRSSAGASAAAAAPSAEKPNAGAPAATPMETAMKCLTSGDNACVVAALEGKARNAQELELLIETYRTLGNTRKAESWMQTYVDKYPSERRAATYRRQLERRQAESAAAP